MYLNFYKKALVSFAAATSLVACSSQKAEDSIETFNLNAIKADSKLSVSQRAEKLALISEQLFTYTNFMHSHSIAEMALSLDPHNKRAYFYKSMTSIMMNYKGLVSRIKPALNKQQKEELQKQVEAFPDSPLKNFLLDGPEDMKSEQDLQKFIDGFITSLNDVRVFMKNNKNLELTLNANDWSWTSFLNKKIKECAAKYNLDQTEVIEIKCPLKDSGKMKLNTADLELIQQAVAGYQLLLSLYNAYDLTGMKALSELPEESQMAMSAGQTWAFLSQFKDFGVYRASAQREKIIEMGLDYVLAARWVFDKQKELCPQGEESVLNREGYAINQGLCVDSESARENDKHLKLVEFILNGGLVPVSSSDNSIQTMAKPAFIFTQPIQDLKDLKPVFKTCTVSYESPFYSETYTSTRIVSVSDSTLNGVIPGGELNDILKLSFENDCAKDQTDAAEFNKLYGGRN